MKYRALIIDDEPYAREELRYILEKTDELEIIAEGANAVDGVRLINELRPDVIFLDIDMPVLNGFEMLSMVDRSLMPYVIFVTAYDQYALKAFEEKALDYILKPVEPERLAKTLDRVIKTLSEGNKPVMEQPPLTRIPCSLKNTIKLIDMSDVESVSSDMTGVHVATSSGEYLTDLTLKVLETRTDLFRCHRQYLVNISRIDRININDNLSASISTRSGREIPVSRRFLKSLKETVGL